jgi:CBS domain-containing protein
VDTPPLFTRPVAELVRGPLVACAATCSVREAARLMAAADTGSIVAVDGQGAALGIVTDSDLRRRVVAEGLDGAVPVAEVMSAPVLAIAGSAPTLQALQRMLEHRVHHLLVVDPSGRPVAVLAGSDILAAEADQPLMLARRLERARDVDELATARAAYPRLVRLLLAGGSGADAVGAVLAETNDRLTRRLLDLAFAELGRPPAPWCWLAMGSEGRREQTLATDQDNGLLVDDNAPPDAEAYFSGLAAWMVAALERTGAARCKGDVMATNPLWRGRLAEWRERFQSWLGEPEPAALLNALIAFDFRPVAGSSGLAEGLRAWLTGHAATARGFLVHVAGTVARDPVAVGLFGRIHTRSGGPLAGTFDLKMQAVGPLVDAARLLALEQGVPATSTLERLAGARQAGAITDEDARDFRAAFVALQALRLRHQVEQAERGEAPGNHLAPRRLARAERAGLREHLGAVQRLRDGATARHALAIRGL